MSRHGIVERGNEKDPVNETELKERTNSMEKRFADSFSENEKQERVRSNAHNNQIADSITTTSTTTTVQQALENVIPLVENVISSPLGSLEVSPTSEAGKDQAHLNKAAKAADKESKASRALKIQAFQATVAVVTGLVAAGNVIYAIIMSQNAGKTPPYDMTPELQRLINAWKDKPDSKFWEEVANFFEKNPQISLLNEAITLKLIVPLCPDLGWVWVEGEFEKAVADFASDIRTGYTSPAYREVMTRKFSFVDAPSAPRVLTRRLACEVLNTAIGRYLRSQGG